MIKFVHPSQFHVLYVTIVLLDVQNKSVYQNTLGYSIKEKQNLSNGKSKEYEVLKNEHGRPLDCIECGQCERVCPQKLPIISNLKKSSMVNLNKFY
mgnify:CR=1 FL=1